VAVLAAGCATVPEGSGGPGSGDEALLARFLACASPEEFIELQRGVDMPRLVEGLEAWSAVRLGAQGPLVEGTEVLTRKRAEFLLDASERYGAFAEVFALYVLHSAFDDEVRALLELLARDKQLAQTLGPMEAVQAELERRGLKLSDFPERKFQPGDVLRGAGRAGRDALNSSPASDGSRFMELSGRGKQLPPPYQDALWEVQRRLTEQHFAPGNVALGGFDHLTFGVPLGFYHLVRGTAEGVSSLARGEYEQATRELAPAALLVALYAGGKGARAASQVRATGWAGVQLRMSALKEVAERLRGRLGESGVVELARYIQARREAAILVAAGGEPAALALHAAKGDVARAQVWLSQAKKSGTGRAVAGGVAAMVDDAAGLTAEVVQFKLRLAEAESAGARLPAEVALLEQQRPRVEAPPPGVASEGLWTNYVAYRERRLAELKSVRKAQGPLRWEGYERMWGQFTRGLAFERSMTALLRADAALPRAQRRWLHDFIQPQIEANVGVSKAGVQGIRFADVLVIEKQPPAGQPPRVESFSFKSRDFRGTTDPKQVAAQMKADAAAALRFYGETLDIRRPSLRLGPSVQIRRVRLVYEGGALKPDPKFLPGILNDVQGGVAGVEVSIQ
jgi:hypothetical protein